jgi:hypothetical protein
LVLEEKSSLLSLNNKNEIWNNLSEVGYNTDWQQTNVWARLPIIGRFVKYSFWWNIFHHGGGYIDFNKFFFKGLRGHYHQIIISQEGYDENVFISPKFNYVFFPLSVVFHGQYLIGWKILCWDVGPLSQTVSIWVLLHKFTWSGIIKLWSRSVKECFLLFHFPVKPDKIDNFSR